MQGNIKNIIKNTKTIMKTARRKNYLDINFPISNFGEYPWSVDECFEP